MGKLIRSKKILSAAEGQACVHCGVRDDTIVAAHYQGLRSQIFGKGKGIKPHDLCVADLCAKCHYEFDNSIANPLQGNLSNAGDPYLRKIDLSEQFLFNILMTLIRRIDQAVIKLDGHKTED